MTTEIVTLGVSETDSTQIEKASLLFTRFKPSGSLGSKVRKTDVFGMSCSRSPGCSFWKW